MGHPASGWTIWHIVITTQNKLRKRLWAFDLELFQHFWGSVSFLYEDVAAIVIETRWCVHCVIYHLSSAPPPTPRAEKWRKRRTCDDVTMRVRDDSCYVPWEGSPCFCFRWSTPALVGSFDLESFVGSKKIDASVTLTKKIVNDHSEIEETSDQSKICKDWSEPVHHN